MAEPPNNQAQIEYWNRKGGQRWVSEQERLDRALAPFDAIGAASLAALGGERAIDLGCGCGASTLHIADAVGPGGAVLGVDVSGPMLARARERAEHRTWIEWLQADAATHAFAPEFDLLYSRFGAMFFEAPTEAFSNVRRGLRSGAQVCLLCWRPLDQNPWCGIPLEAVSSLLPASPVVVPDAPGPFAFSQPARVRAVLSDAGFEQIHIEPADARVVLSTTGLEEAVAFTAQAGPVARLLVDTDAATRAAVSAALSTALAPYASAAQVELLGGIWVVTARAP